MKRLLGAVLAIFVLAGCVNGPDPPPVAPSDEPAAATDDTPTPEEAAGFLAQELLESEWLHRYRETADAPPVLMVATAEADPTFDFDPYSFARLFEQHLLEASFVSFVAAGDQRDVVRAERLDQQSSATMETVARLAEETGAGFYLFQFLVPSFVDGTARIDLQLVEIESAKTVWIANSPVSVGQTRFDAMIPVESALPFSTDPHWRIVQRSVRGNGTTIHAALNEATLGSDRIVLIIRNTDGGGRNGTGPLVVFAATAGPADEINRRSVLAVWRFSDETSAQHELWPIERLPGIEATVAIPPRQDEILRRIATHEALYIRLGRTTEAVFDLRGLSDALRDAGIDPRAFAGRR